MGIRAGGWQKRKHLLKGAVCRLCFGCYLSMDILSYMECQWNSKTVPIICQCCAIFVPVRLNGKNARIISRAHKFSFHIFNSLFLESIWSGWIFLMIRIPWKDLTHRTDTGYFTLDNDRVVVALIWPKRKYLGLVELPVGSRVELDFQPTLTGKLNLKGVTALYVPVQHTGHEIVMDQLEYGSLWKQHTIDER